MAAEAACALPNSRLNSDKVICGVLEEDCRLSEDESSEKESTSNLVCARKRL